ncbi:transposase [Parvibium lacunae]|uniref:Transposase n=1 Tax=Parvibium lacunae TaxID=1888893 RepID=A0A368KZN4_9BURK|nr:transposase [Parvibium lacunae]RCS56584.1 transposase [Parvibium lacunae]
MARQPRLFIPDCPQHVIQRGNDRQIIFREARDYELFLEWLRYAAIEQEVRIHAYVLMPNHFHLLVSTSNERGLARLLQSVGRRYVPYVNQRYGRTGTLWEGRYRAAYIESERYLFNCYRYIELNPVRAAIVQEPGHYKWSSYRANAGLAKDPLLTFHPNYWALGNTPFEREASYRQWVTEGHSTEELAAIRSATYKNSILGSNDYIAAVSKALGRALVPAKRGRPPRNKTVPN